jgi:hypothetical protein
MTQTNNVVVTVEAIETTVEKHNDFEVLVNPKDFGIDAIQEERVLITDIINHFEEEYNLVVNSKEITKEVVEKAHSLKKVMTKIGTTIEKIHKERKEYWLTGGRIVDKWKNENIELVEVKKKSLIPIEKHFENLENERKLRLKEERIKMLAPYEVDCTFIDLIGMPDEHFNAFVQSSKLTYEAKIEAQRKAELERIETERLDAIERQRLNAIAPYTSFMEFEYNYRDMPNDDFEKILSDAKAKKVEYETENARLKAEAELKDKELELERQRADAERKKIEAENQAKLKAEQDAKAKLEAELKAKQDAELKAQKEREDAELKAKKEAEKLAKAPIKKQLSLWVNRFELPEFSTETQTANDIKAKFEAFKKWSLEQIEQL